MPDKLEANRCSAGFTLVETMVALLVFSITVAITVGIFARATQIQRQAFDAQRVVENMIFTMEALSRDIRVSEICVETSPACLLTSLTITHPSKGKITYALDTARGVLTKTEEGILVDMTADDVNFTKFNFWVRGVGIDNRQPRVTMVISVQNRTGQVVQFNLQASITSRDVTDEFQN